jgi:hypothetical protein
MTQSAAEIFVSVLQYSHGSELSYERLGLDDGSGNHAHGIFQRLLDRPLLKPPLDAQNDTVVQDSGIQSFYVIRKYEVTPRDRG